MVSKQKSWWDKALTKTKNAIANPNVIKASKVANGVLDIAARLGQAKVGGPLAWAGASVGALDVLVKSFDIEVATSIEDFIESHQLVYKRSALGRCIIELGMDTNSNIEFKKLAGTKKEILYGIEHQGEVFSFKVRQGLVPEITTACYYTPDFDFSFLADTIWEGLGSAATITWDDEWHAASVRPETLRNNENYAGSFDPAELKTEIDQFRERGISYAILCYGLPGTGKTSYVHSFAQLDGGRMVVLTPEIADRMSNEEVELLFDVLQPRSILLDDVDRVEKRFQKKIMSFAEAMRIKFPQMVVFGTCNSKMGKALVRPGRLGGSLEFMPPDKDTKKELIEIYSDKYQVDISQLDIDELVAAMDHPEITHDYVRFVMERAVVLNQAGLIRLIGELKDQFDIVKEEE